MKRMLHFVGVVFLLVVIFVEQTAAATPSTVVMNKKVLMIVYDPILSNGKKLTAYKQWQNPATMRDFTINSFKTYSNNRLNYSIVDTIEINNVWLRKIDGFTYTEQQYLNVIDNGGPNHSPDYADYSQFIDNQQFDICGRANRGEIDEVWIYGGPWFGLYESNLVGQNAFYYNSGPTYAPNCNKLVPIMGYSYEAGIGNAVHNFGHRMESTMKKVYGTWSQNSISHNWNKFSLVKGENATFDFSYMGCGDTHFPPNATSGYQYSGPASVQSNCADFKNYPDLAPAGTNLQTVSCQTWGCTDLGYYEWWFKALPANTGRGPDGKLNDWWQYLADPNLVLSDNQSTNGTFANLSAEMPYNGSATFAFSYSGQSSSFVIDASTVANMSTDVYVSYAQGGSPPVIETNPKKWDKYSCGRTLYWQVTSASGAKSAIQSTVVSCITGNPTASPIPSCPLKTSGDTDCDGAITISDFEVIRRNLNVPGPNPADINGNGVVDSVDYAIWFNNMQVLLP